MGHRIENRSELEHLAKRVRYERLKRKWSLREMAEKCDCGLSLQMLSNIEMARYWPSLTVYAAICRLLGLGNPPMLVKTPKPEVKS